MATSSRVLGTGRDLDATIASYPLPPRPPGSTLTHTRRFFNDPFSLLEEAQEACGDLFMMRLLGQGHWVFLCSGQLLHEMHALGEDTLVAGEANREMLGYLIGTNASFSMDGEAYLERRQLILPHLNGRKVMRHLATIHQVVAETMATWTPGTPFPFLPSADRLSLEITLRVLVGQAEPAAVARVLSLSERFFQAVQTPGVAMPALQWKLGRLTPWGRFVKLREELYGALGDLVDQRLRQDESGEATDVLGAVVQAHRAGDDAWSREAIVHEILNIMSAGIESTAKILVWTLLAILQNDEVAARLRREIDAALGDRPLAAADLRQLSFLQAVLDEGIRHRPIGPFAGIRRVRRPVVIGGYRMPVGAILAHCIPATSHDERVFTNPEAFAPERFLGGGPKGHSWTPFGAGTRVCLGRGLAYLEMAVVIATVLQRGDLRLAPGPLGPVRRGFLYVPENGLMLDYRPRSAGAAAADAAPASA